MSKLHEAARQALDALEKEPADFADWVCTMKNARTALREALSGVQALSAAPVRDVEREAFKTAHRHLELDEVPDAWGRPMFKYSHVEASWLGWIARAARAPAEQQAAPKAAPGEQLTREQIREVFMANGFTIKEGQTDLKQYVYDAAHALLELVAAPPAEQQAAAKAAPATQQAGELVSVPKAVFEKCEVALKRYSQAPTDYHNAVLRLRDSVRDLIAAAASQQEAQESEAIAKRRAKYLRNDNDSARAYVAKWFRSIGLPYYDDYIQAELAGDFVCSLAVALATAPQPAPAPLSEREAFEAAWEKLHGRRPVLWSRMCAEHKMEPPPRSEGNYFAAAEQAAWKLWQDRAARAPADSVTAPAVVVGPDGMMRDELRSMIEGMSVSVDVSTGGDDAGHRYFGTVTEVMDCRDDKHGVTLLVQDAEPNFALTPPTHAAESVMEDAARLERERICAAIKAEDDYCVDQGDYMLDSDDCIKIVRGEWVRPDFAIDAARKQGASHDNA